MLSKMAQSNNVGGGGGGGATGGGSSSSGRRVPLSLSGSSVPGSAAVSRVQQATGSNGRSNSPQSSSKKEKQEQLANGPFISLKKTNAIPPKAAAVAAAKEEEKKGQNGVGKSANIAAKANGSGSSNVLTKEQPTKPKEKQPEKKEEEAPGAPKEPNKAQIVDLDNDPDVIIVPTTPTSERKSSRRQQKTPNKVEQAESSPAQKKPEPEAEVEKQKEAVPVAVEAAAPVVEDVEMEALAVEASPVRNVAIAQPAATSTPGRNLFGFRSASKQLNEVELASQSSSSPGAVPARSFAQISGRRSIRPASTLTPGKLGNYRCLNTSELDTSNCTNASMNATVGSEIPNSSSFSFSFFGRGRKRERTPPPLSGSQSTNDLGHDVEMSPPKRARFELFSLNLASPFSMLRSRFSKATISSPSSRLNQTPPAGEEEEAEKGGEVQNVSGIVIQEEEEQLNKSTTSTTAEVTVGQEAGQETPKKSDASPAKEQQMEQAVEFKKTEQGDDVFFSVPTAADLATETEGPNRSRCALM